MVMTRWCAWALATAMVVGLGGMGCGDDDEEGDDAVEKPDDLGDQCEAACERVYDSEGCATIFEFPEDEGGGGMPQATCVDRCTDEEMFRGGQWCVATEAECRDDPWEMIVACFPDDYHPEACADLGWWELHWEEQEERVVELLNDHRQAGTDCPSEAMDPVDALAMNELLRCGARSHSVDMVEEGYFDTEDSQGRDGEAQMEAVGYSPDSWRMLVNDGEDFAEQWVDNLMASDEHCQIMMDGQFEEIGVGRYDLRRWTLYLAAPE